MAAGAVGGLLGGIISSSGTPVMQDIRVSHAGTAGDISVSIHDI